MTPLGTEAARFDARICTATMAADPVFIDTNVLIYATRRAASEHCRSGRVDPVGRRRLRTVDQLSDPARVLGRGDPTADRSPRATDRNRNRGCATFPAGLPCRRGP